MKQTYTGSCHCNAVRYEADIDLTAGSGKCNCSFCTKMRNWNVVIKPADFRLLSGEDALSDYQFAGKSCHHLFCRHCGIHPFSKGYVEAIGGDFISVQLATLDNVAPEQLIHAEVRYANGRDNLWWQPPAETRHL